MGNKFFKASLFLDLFILIADTLLIRGIIRKMNNMYSGLKEYVPVTYQIESNLKKADFCILCDMLLNLVQLVRAFKAYITDDTSDSQVNCEICNVKENNCNNNYNNNDDNNQVNAYTTRTNANLVSPEKKYVTSLKDVLPEEVSSKLDYYKEKGNSILFDLINFYLEMNFEGLTRREDIIKEISHIVFQLTLLLVKKGDDVANICFLNSQEEEEVTFLLMRYSFSLVIMAIKLKI